MDGEGRIIPIDLNERERELGLLPKATKYLKQSKLGFGLVNVSPPAEDIHSLHCTWRMRGKD